MNQLRRLVNQAVALLTSWCGLRGVAAAVVVVSPHLLTRPGRLYDLEKVAAAIAENGGEPAFLPTSKSPFYE